MITQLVRDFYVSHSATSNPGSLSSMLDALPVNIGELIDITGGSRCILTLPVISLGNRNQPTAGQVR